MIIKRICSKTGNQKTKDYINIRNINVNELKVIVYCLESKGYNALAKPLKDVLKQPIDIDDMDFSEEDRKQLDKMETELKGL